MDEYRAFVAQRFSKKLQRRKDRFQEHRSTTSARRRYRSASLRHVKQSGNGVAISTLRAAAP